MSPMPRLANISAHLSASLAFGGNAVSTFGRRRHFAAFVHTGHSTARWRHLRWHGTLRHRWSRWWGHSRCRRGRGSCHCWCGLCFVCIIVCALSRGLHFHFGNHFAGLFFRFAHVFFSHCFLLNKRHRCSFLLGCLWSCRVGQFHWLRSGMNRL